MDVHICDYRDCDDDCTCVCSASHLANSGILPLFASRFDVGKSFCFASCVESAVDVVLFLGLGLFYIGYGVT